MSKRQLEQWLFEKLYVAYIEARKNKRGTADEQKFEYAAMENLLNLMHSILNQTYHPGRGVAFIIHKPVIREIFAAQFRDRIVHHLLFNFNADWWERHFITDSYSCRKGKGTQFGISRLQHHIQAVTDNYKKEAYVIKLDIQGYFMSLSREALYEQILWGLNRQYKDKEDPEYKICKYLWKEVIFDDPIRGVVRRDSLRAWDDLPSSKSLFCQPSGRGIVIGNLSSQLLSNIYLSQLDRFVMFQLGYKHYGRYVDDFFLIVTPEEYPQALRDVEVIARYLEILGLYLHPKKKYIQPVSKGVPFLGVVVYPGRVVPGKRIKHNFHQALRDYMMDLSDAEVITSYLGHLRHMKSGALRKKTFESVGWEYLF